MIRIRGGLLLLVAASIVMTTAVRAGQGPESKAYVLNVSEMQTFTDVGSGDQTKPELVTDFKELDGERDQGRFLEGRFRRRPCGQGQELEAVRHIAPERVQPRKGDRHARAEHLPRSQHKLWHAHRSAGGPQAWDE